ncbi:MAG TPA: hypothetical protein VKB68_08520 [Stellaceae bacterium]|nr:hypothetical protein [Stellaceae bacterium]
MGGRGIVFFASGKRYIDEAGRAVARSQQFNAVPHMIFCSEPPKRQTGALIEIFKPSKNVWQDRIDCLRSSPFDETIYLDVDCAVLEPIVELFDLLSVYEIAAAHAPGYRGKPDLDVPAAFFELNCGVLVYRRSDRTVGLFDMWRSLYRAWYRERPFHESDWGDQPAFRHAVWKSKIPIYVLGPEYNWRPVFPSFLVERPKILHGYHDDPEAIARIANEHVGVPHSLKALIPNRTELSGTAGEID